MFNLKFFIIVIFLLFSEITIYSQNPKSRLRITLSASVFDIITKQPIKEAELRITNQYKSTDSITLFSDKDGAFKYYDKYYELKCNVNDVFKITFSAKNYNSRTVFFDFRGILDKDIFDQGYEVPIDLPLEKLEINSDSSITNLLASIPSGRISYNPNTGELDWDMIQINSYKKRMYL